MLQFGRKSKQLSYGCENQFEIRNFEQIFGLLSNKRREQAHSDKRLFVWHPTEWLLF